MLSTKPGNSKWAAVNDGDDGDHNDDEDAVNKNLNDGKFFRSSNANFSSNTQIGPAEWKPVYENQTADLPWRENWSYMSDALNSRHPLEENVP